jgi:hypothetical protein
MNQTIMVSNLIILSNSFSSAGGDGALFPHAWALLIWFTISAVAFVLGMFPWMEWSDQLYAHPTANWMHEHNALYRRKLTLLFGTVLLISIVSAVVPLYLGL